MSTSSIDPDDQAEGLRDAHWWQAQCNFLQFTIQVETQRRQAAEKRLTKAMESNKANMEEAKKEKAKIREKHRINLDRYKIEIEEAKQDLVTESGYTAELRERYKSLNENLEELKEKTASLPLKLEIAEAKIQVLEAKIAEMEYEKLTSKTFLGLQSEIAVLQDANSRFMGERDNNMPLLTVGFHVRHRFIEQAQEVVGYAEATLVSKQGIKNGNKAAHEGNMEADAVIFNAFVWPNDAATASLRALYRELYHADPHNHHQYPSSLREAINCEVTIRTGRAVNERLIRPVQEKQAAMDNIEWLRKKYPSLSGEEYNKHPEVNRRLALVREFTISINQIERTRSARSVPLQTRPGAPYVGGQPKQFTPGGPQTPGSVPTGPRTI